MPRAVDRLTTERLVLEPLSAERAASLAAGDLGSVVAAPGWPHADTADALALAAGPGAGPTWLVVADGAVVGDAGAFAWPAAGGPVAVGYGLAEGARGRGYATEALAAICHWLVTAAGAGSVTAEVAVGNAPSCRVLEKLGFTLVAEADGQRDYAWEPGW